MATYRTIDLTVSTNQCIFLIVLVPEKIMPEVTRIYPFQQAIEAVENLSLEDQAMLLEIIQKRLNQQRRAELVKEIAELRKEYAEGNVRFGSVEDFLTELDEE